MTDENANEREIQIEELAEADQSLLFDIFCRIIAEMTGRTDIHPEGFSVRKEYRDDGMYLFISTGLSMDVAVEWSGSFVDAIRDLIDIAESAAWDLDMYETPRPEG